MCNILVGTRHGRGKLSLYGIAAKFYAIAKFTIRIIPSTLSSSIFGGRIEALLLYYINSSSI